MRWGAQQRQAAELAVLMGVGVAVAFGWGCAVASADDAGSSATGSHPTTSNDTSSAATSSRPAVTNGQQVQRAVSARSAASTGGLSAKKVVRTAQSGSAVGSTQVSAPPPTSATVGHFQRQAQPVAAATVDNSLTYTPKPALRDLGALAVLHVMRGISDLIGVDLYAQINSAIASSSPPPFLRGGLHVQQTTYTTQDNVEWKVWEIAPANPSGKAVIALHGGGFISQPNLLHWIDYTDMARQTGATVVVPLYPLATTDAGKATVVIPDTADFISAQIETYGAENVSVYGDSAGSTLAMSAVRQLVLADKPVPSSMVLLSLAADFSLQNPDVYKVDDPILQAKGGTWASHFTDGITDLTDPLVSPLFFESEVLQALPPTTIYVGQNEILMPDTLLLHDRAVAENAPISVVVGTGLVHDWPLSGLPIYTQTGRVRGDIYRQLGLVGE